MAELREGLRSGRRLAFFRIRLLDLQVWFNLVWIDPLLDEEDEFLKGLVKKAEGIPRKKKKTAREAGGPPGASDFRASGTRRNRARSSLPRRPFYHPILPLVRFGDRPGVYAADAAAPPRSAVRKTLEAAAKGLDISSRSSGSARKALALRSSCIHGARFVAQCESSGPRPTRNSGALPGAGHRTRRAGQGPQSLDALSTPPPPPPPPHLLETPSGPLSMVFAFISVRPDRFSL